MERVSQPRHRSIFARWLPPLALAVLCILSHAPQSAAQCDGRYLEEIFDSVIITTVQYGENYDSHGQLEPLFLDVYEPYGDVEAARPLILLAHGGAFILGGRRSGEIVRLCESFARRGYVCASIDYRKESEPLNLFSEEQMIKAIIRAMHDGKAAVRFFKRSFEEGDLFAIDPGQVIVGGVSAGAILMLNMVYLTSLEMASWPWDIWAEQLGGLEGNSGNPGYDSEVIGIINAAGAFGKPYWIHGNDVPILSIHGVRDPIVPYGVGKPLGIPWLPNLFGSLVVHQRSVEAGIPSMLISYPDRGHVPFLNFPESFFLEDVPFIQEEIFDSTLRHIRDFAWGLLDCNPSNQVVTVVPDDLAREIGIYPNPTSGPIDLTVPEDLAGAHLAIYAMDGSLAVELVMDGTQMRSHLALPAGIYALVITTPDGPAGAYRRLITVAY